MRFFFQGSTTHLVRRQACSVFFQRWKCTVDQARQKQNKPPAKKNHNEERRALSDEEAARSVL